MVSVSGAKWSHLNTEGSRRVCCQCWRQPVERWVQLCLLDLCGIPIFKKKKKRKKKFSGDHFKNIFNDGTHTFLFALLEEGFFPMFVLGTNKVVLESKTKERTYEQNGIGMELEQLEWL